MKNDAGFKLSRREFVAAASVAASLAATPTQAISPKADARNLVRNSPKPAIRNVIVVMTDQQRADFSAAEGFPFDVTPSLDRLGRDGTRFNKAYTVTPVCMPARVSMLTGRYPSAHGIRGNQPLHGLTYGEDLLDVMNRLGGSCVLLGKNHSHRGKDAFVFSREYGHGFGPPRPDNRQEDEAFNRWMMKLFSGISDAPTPFPLECQYPVRIIDDAIAYLEEFRQEPLFMWISFPEPHNPYQVPVPYWNMFPPDKVPDRVAGPEILERKGYPWTFERDLIGHYHPDCEHQWRRYRSNYMGMTRLIDDQLGRFLTYMEESGLREDTLIVYVSDHGDYAGDYGLVRKGVGVPECLVRIPMVWSGPGVVAREDFHPAHVSLADVMPTICEAIGADIPPGVQGRSLWPLLTGQDYPETEFSSAYVEHGFGGLAWTEEEKAGYEDLSFILGNPNATNKTFQELNFVTQSGRRRMVRKGDWKLTMDADWGGEFYNLAQDPGELNNRFDDPTCREAQAELMRDLLQWTIRVSDGVPIPGYNYFKRGDHNWER